MLKQRIITALVLLPFALGGFFLLNGTLFALFIGAVVSLGAWEWARLAGFTAQVQRVAYAALVATLLFGLLILLPAWQGLVLFKQWPEANWLILAVMVLVWGADIGAYFAGRRFGKRKLAPQVSPGKSWEGVFGGLLATLLICVGVAIYRDWSFASLLLGLIGTAVVVLISVVGDLTESMFKRQSGVKDSSNLLPGHGGVLDRIDSLTAAIPVFAALLWLAGWVKWQRILKWMR